MSRVEILVSKRQYFMFGLLVGLLLSPAILFFIAVVTTPLHTEAAPSCVEATLARFAFDRAVRRMPVVTNPYGADEATLSEGMKLYRDNCAGCHGTPSGRSDWGANHFYPPVPQFGEYPPHRTDSQVFQIVKHGIRYSGMGGWSGMLPDEQIWKIATFISHLESLPPDLGKHWREPPKALH